MGKANAHAAAFGANLKRFRLAAGMTQAELGGRVKPPLVVAAIARYEAGGSEPKIGVVSRLAEALGIESAALMPANGRRKK